jgi:hypothetical protein
MSMAENRKCQATFSGVENIKFKKSMKFFTGQTENPI